MPEGVPGDEVILQQREQNGPPSHSQGLVPGPTKHQHVTRGSTNHRLELPLATEQGGPG